MPDIGRKTIVVIDDNPVNVQFILIAFRNIYNMIPFTSGKAALEYFHKGNGCDIILLDIEMPEINGFDVIKALKAIDCAKHIPVIFLTGNMEVDAQVKGLSLGAVDYIFKPFIPELVRKRVEIHIDLEEYKTDLERLVEQKTRTIEKISDVTVQTIVSIIGSRDQETSGHISRTSEYVVTIAEELSERGMYTDELTEENIYMLRKSAPLHDVGKVGIIDSILLKPGKLTSEEFREMKKHTVIGGDAFAKAREMMGEPSFLDFAEMLAMYHHERWDGTGYPLGLSGRNIPLFARIMAIADVYDALISHRPYKEPMPHEEAVHIIAAGKGSHFDPDICDAFVSIERKILDIATRFDG